MFKVYSSFVLVMVCAACGSTFSVAGASGGSGSGQAGDASGGQPSTAGDANGGDAGETGVAGTSSAGNGGAPAGGAGTSAGNGGASAGTAGSAGSSTGNDCARLKQDYQTALEKAKVCDQGSTQQCSASSTVEALSCGCPVLVNAKSEYTAAAKKARQAFLDAKCVDGVLCSAIACVPITDASCAPAAATGSSFVCTAITAIAN